MESRKAILVASFGTSYNDTRERTIDRMESDVGSTFGDWTVRRAFTSKMIIRKLEKRDNVKVDYIDEALERLESEGFTEVVVLPFLIMNGVEYDDIIRIVGDYTDRFDKVSISKPLLSSERDFDELTGFIINELLPEARSIGGEDTGLVLMGHGSDHYSNGAFPELQMKLVLNGSNDVFVTTIEGFPRFSDLESIMGDRASPDAVTAPLLLVSGDHANRDMVGEQPSSLKSVLESNGYRVHPLMKGISEYATVRRMFIRHVKEAM